MDATVNVKAINAVLPDPVLGWAAPNPTDQAAMLGMLGGLYDKLVADVAARVVATMAEKPVFVCDTEMRAVASAVFDEKIDGALENYDCSDAIDEALKDHDIDAKVEDAVEEIDFDSKVEEALDNFDWEDRLKGVIRNLQFSLVAR